MIYISEQIKPRYITTDLGSEKYCKGCDEYYPATKEFFFGTGRLKKDGTHCLETLCKACYKEKYKPHFVRTYNISHRYRGAA